MNKDLGNIELEGEHIKLLPLKQSHAEELIKVTEDGKLWELWYTLIPNKDKMDAYIKNALLQKEQGTAFPFVVIDKKTRKVIGSTRFYNIQPENRRLEIGFTWYAQSYQRTGVNTACKYLLLEYAFESLNCIAVQFMTDWFNMRSRNAIERLGAKQDGVLRNHRINADGSYRDSVVYSITEQEWPGVKKSLAYKIKKYKEIRS